MATHTCPAAGCEKEIPRHMLACRSHWYQIPKPLRDEIWSTYDNGNGMGSPAHSLAIAEACEWLRKVMA